MPPKPKKSKKRFRVFVSHATADKWVAKSICERIDAIAGAATFRDDRHIGGGDEIARRIREEIRDCDQFLVLLTAASIHRTWVVLEIGMAYSHEKPIVPIWYNTPVESIALLALNKGYQLDDLDRYLEDLERKVKGWKT